MGGVDGARGGGEGGDVVVGSSYKAKGVIGSLRPTGVSGVPGDVGGKDVPLDVGGPGDDVLSDREEERGKE